MMDRSFLSDAAVVAASREYVCIRLATYESAAEAEVLTSVFRSRSGVLENTVFALLEPDGRTLLAPSGRTHREALGGPSGGAVRLAELGKRGTSTSPVGGALPLLADLRRGMNVATCDLQPIVGIVAADEEKRAEIEKELLPLAWSKDYIGRFAYARAKDVAEAAAYVDGLPRKDGIFVVQPDAFGQKGKLLAFGELKGLPAALSKGLKAFVATAKDSRRHIDEGVRRGVVWESEIPVTDPKVPSRR